MYPKRQPQELLGELIGAALEELEASLPYVKGSQVVNLARDLARSLSLVSIRVVDRDGKELTKDRYPSLGPVLAEMIRHAVPLNPRRIDRLQGVSS